MPPARSRGSGADAAGVGERRLLWCAAVLLAAGLAVGNLLLGNLNQDEGWYLLAALRVAEGARPYRDFLFTQGPVMPAVYGLLSPLWAPFGLLGGRILTQALGLLAVLLALGSVRRVVPASQRGNASLVVWLLCACVPVHGYFTTIPKTYALTAVWLCAAYGLLALRAGPGAHAASGALLALAAATRISMAPALPLTALVLWGRASDRRAGRRHCGLFCAGALAGLALTYGLAALGGFDGLRFALLYHGARETQGVGAWAVLRGGFVSRALQAYPLPWIAVGWLTLQRPRRWIDPSLPPALLAAQAAVAGITALHALSPFPYDDYQTPVMPLLAWIVAAHLARPAAAQARPAAADRMTPRALTLAAVLLALASPLLMEWVVIRQDRLWFERKAVPDLFALRAVGRRLRSGIAPGEVLLTQDAYLAVEARRGVPPGLEMGPFSLFPDLSPEQARRRRVHTVATLTALLRQGDAPWAATSGYSFAIAAPGTGRLAEADRQALLDALAESYEPAEVIPDFGQNHTTLTLWRRKEHPAP